MNGASTGGTISQQITALLQRERFAAAQRLLNEQRQALDPASRAALEAAVQLGLAEFDSAERLAQEALALDPATPAAMFVLGGVAEHLRRDATQAAQWYRRATLTDPHYAPAQYALGRLLLGAGYLEPATEALRAALAQDPDNWRYRAGVAMVAPPSSRPLALRAAYRSGVREQPGDLGLRLRVLGTYLTAPFAPLAGAHQAATPAQLGIAAYQRLLARPVALTYLLLAVNVLLVLLMEAQGGSQNPAILERFGAEDPTAIIHGGQWWRLLTPLFLHAGYTHLAVNGISLFVVGRLYERCVGAPRFLYVYLVAGLGGSVTSLAFTPGLAVGASGAIFGVFGALGVYFFRNRALFGRIARSLVSQILVLSVINLLLPNVVSNIDGWAHVGGLLVGVLAAWAAGPRLPVPGPHSTPDSVLVEQRGAPLALLQMTVVVLLLLAATVAVCIWNPAGA